MPNTFRGKAQVTGTKFVADIVLYPIANSLKLTQNWKEEIVEDEQGDDYAIRAHNEKWDGDLGMILVDKSSTSTLANAKAGAAFYAPLTSITVTTCDVAAWVGVFQVQAGSDLGQENTQAGKFGVKLRRWADSAQNTLLNTTPG